MRSTWYDNGTTWVELGSGTTDPGAGVEFGISAFGSSPFGGNP